MFQIGNLSSFLARQSILMNNSILIKFPADPGVKGPRFCLTLDKITFRLIAQ